MNRYDRMLAWVSEVGKGSWSQWRQACAHLDLEPTVCARALSALAHVELDWAEDHFAAAAPTAAFIPRSSGSVIVTGARPRDARDRLARLCGSEDFNVWFHPPVPQAAGPETWLVEAETAGLQAFCQAAGIVLEVDPGRRILEAMPRSAAHVVEPEASGRVRQRLLDAVAEPQEPDDRFSREWVYPETGEPRDDVAEDREGLWFVSLPRRKTAFLRHSGEWFRIPVREYGMYVAYPDHIYVRHDSRRWQLVVMDRAPLPPLLARAATLQSGRLPMPSGRGLHVYANISPEIAELIGDRLCTGIGAWNERKS